MRERESGPDCVRRCAGKREPLPGLRCAFLYALPALRSSGTKSVAESAPKPISFRCRKQRASGFALTVRRVFAMKGNHWTSLLTLSLQSGATRVLLYGPPGTGKTTSATRIVSGFCGTLPNTPTRTEWRYERVTLHADSVSDDLVGGFRLRSSSNGTETYFEPGSAARAMRFGSVLVLDEVDHAGSAVTSTLHAVLDDSEIARIVCDGETVTPAPGYVVIATMNGNPSDLPAPVLDRFDCIIHADCACDDALAGIPETLRRMLCKPEPTFTAEPTPRRLRALCRLMGNGMDRESAARVTFGNAAPTVLTAIGASR